MRADLAPPSSHGSGPLLQVVLEALAAHVAVYEPGELGTPVHDAERWPHLASDVGSDVGHRGLACRPAGGTRFHDLRHYYASLLIRHSESVKGLQARLGHASAAEILDTYLLVPVAGLRDRTRDAIDLVLGADS